MSIEQIEDAILEMPAEQRVRLLKWLDEHRDELFKGLEDVSEDQKAELLTRQGEYYKSPDKFGYLNSEAEVDQFFNGIRREVQTRISSTRKS